MPSSETAAEAASAGAAPAVVDLLALCRDFGLVSFDQPSPRGLYLRCVSQEFDVTLDEAEILLQGLLLGFFYGHARDDLSMARWTS